MNDYDPVTSVGQQFLTMVSKKRKLLLYGDRPERKGEENVHLLNSPAQREEFAIRFGKGLEEPFTSKNGREFMQRIRILNQNSKDKTHWASFVLPAKAVHENQYGKGLWARISADRTSIVAKRF